MACELNDCQLIEYIRQFPNLYDKNHGDYRNKQAKINAWISIGEMLGVSGTLCEQRWSVLRHRYARELRARKTNYGNNSIPWIYLEEMSFLEEYIAQRRTRSEMMMFKDKKPLQVNSMKTELKIEPDGNICPISIRPETLLTMNIRSISPIDNNSATTPPSVSPPPVSVSTVSRFSSVLSTSDNAVTSSIHNNSCPHSECKEKQEMEDEDLLFGKSIGHTLRSIKNKKIKLQVKSEILSILAQHADSFE